MSTPLLQLQDLSKNFDAGGMPFRHRHLRAVEGVNFEVHPGETLGIVGESGSGKSTLCRLVLGLTPPSTGSVIFEGKDLGQLSRLEMRRTRRRMQAVFQDSSSAFNPRHTVRASLMAPLDVHGVGDAGSRARLVEETLRQVGLDSGFLGRHPHALSGGERQRVAIARAIILRPALVVADEPTSALDVSVQARILNLFRQIQAQLNLTYVFVSHNLGVIRYVSDRVAVMYLGEIVEIGPIETVFSSPQHPYTRALLRAIPQADPARRQLDPPVLGELPSAFDPPSGCRFHTRCPVAMAGTCAEERPQLYPLGESHGAACLWHDPRYSSGAPEWIARPGAGAVQLGAGPSGSAATPGSPPPGAPGSRPRA